MDNKVEESPLVYTPQAPKAQPAQQAGYELVKDVTGEAPPKRPEPQILNAIKYVDGEKKVGQFRVPFPPNPKCKRCYGRGYVGFIKETVLICKKCYPLMNQ